MRNFFILAMVVVATVMMAINVRDLDVRLQDLEAKYQDLEQKVDLISVPVQGKNRIFIDKEGWDEYFAPSVPSFKDISTMYIVVDEAEEVFERMLLTHPQVGRQQR